MKKIISLFLILILLLSALTGCSTSNPKSKQNNSANGNNYSQNSFAKSTFPEIIHVFDGETSVWSYAEIEKDIYNTSKINIYPIRPTAIYTTSGNVFNSDDAIKIAELPYKISKDNTNSNTNTNDIYVRVMNITPSDNNWLVIEEYLAGKDWNQGTEKLIGLNIDSKKQIDIAEGSNAGGSFFNYIVYNNYVIYNIKSLSTDSTNIMSKTSILNIDDSKIQNLPVLTYNPQTEPDKVKIDNSRFEIKDNALFINGVKFTPSI